MRITPIQNFDIYNKKIGDYKSRSTNISPALAFCGDNDDIERLKQKLEKLAAKLDKKEQDLKAQEERIEKENKRLDQRVKSVAFLEENASDIIEGAFRVRYGINVPIEEYKAPTEQMLHVAQFMNKHGNIFQKQDRETALKFIEILKNKKGSINSDVLEFLDQIFDIKKEQTDFTTIKAIIYSVINKNEHVDTEKGATFKANYTLKNENLLSTLEVMKENFSYGSENPEDQTIDPVTRLVENHRAAEEDRAQRAAEVQAQREAQKEEGEKKAKELIIKSINEDKNCWGRKKYTAVIGEDGLIEIDTHGHTFYPVLFGSYHGINHAFKYIGKVYGNMSFGNCDKTYAIRLGALKYVSGDIKKNGVPIPDSVKVDGTIY